MSCCKNDLKLSIVQFGVSDSWITETLKTWGPDVLEIILLALKNGLSVSFVIEVVQKFGPVLLEFIVNLLKQYQKMGVAVEDPKMFDKVLIETVVQKYLPQLVSKYPDECSKLVSSWISERL